MERIRTLSRPHGRPRVRSGNDDTNPEMAWSDPSGALSVEGCLYDGEHKAKDMIRCC